MELLYTLVISDVWKLQFWIFTDCDKYFAADHVVKKHYNA